MRDLRACYLDCYGSAMHPREVVRRNSVPLNNRLGPLPLGACYLRCATLRSDDAMNTPLIVGIISAATAIVLAVAGFTLTRRRDRELEWRKLKLERYQEYVASLSGIVGRRSTPEGQARYSDAFNGLVLVAPAPLLKTLYAFHAEQRINNPA
ncbi:MAG TPA: hypothetical protein VJU82_00610 [Acidobacteriaceae bacterium]|nr:hypothetical protein [Acidobacteriaceae bacterium]